MKDKLLKLLETKPLTVYEMMEKLRIDDELIVVDMIAELEIMNKVQLINFKTGYEPDGCAFYLSRYGIIKPRGVSII